MRTPTYTPRPNDVVVYTANPDGDRYLILGGATVDPRLHLTPHALRFYEGYRAGGDVPRAGWHVQNLTTGHLGTFRAADLRLVGKATEEAEGLLERPRVRLSRKAAA